MKKVLAFTLGVNHPSSRMRIAAYQDHLWQYGWDLQLHPFDSGMGKTQPREDSSWSRMVRRGRRGLKTLSAIKALRQLRPEEPIIVSRELPVSAGPFLTAPNPLLLDVDDALYLESGRERLLELCRRAEVVVCGNDIIAENLAGFSRRCVVIPTGVKVDRYQPRTDYRQEGVVRIGWLGSSMSIEQTLFPFLEVLEKIRAGLAFELVVISNELPESIKKYEWIRFLKWSPEVEASIAGQMDIGIMPLQDNPYQAAKCGAKLAQYMAAGLPVIATPIGVNRELVVNGRTGYWAARPEEWVRAIRELAGQQTLRESFGRAGRERAETHYSIAHLAKKWASLLNESTRQPV